MVDDGGDGDGDPDDHGELIYIDTCIWYMIWSPTFSGT